MNKRGLIAVALVAGVCGACDDGEGTSVTDAGMGTDAKAREAATPSGACDNEGDREVIATFQMTEDATPVPGSSPNVQYGLCISRGELDETRCNEFLVTGDEEMARACVDMCIAGTELVALSEACADCYFDEVVCGGMQCAAECFSTGRPGEDCLNCLEEKCAPPRAACTGL